MVVSKKDFCSYWTLFMRDPRNDVDSSQSPLGDSNPNEFALSPPTLTEIQRIPWKNFKKYFKNIIKKKKSTLTTNIPKKKRKISIENLTHSELILVIYFLYFLLLSSGLAHDCTLLQLHLCTLLVVKFEHTYMRGKVCTYIICNIHFLKKGKKKKCG